MQPTQQKRTMEDGVLLNAHDFDMSAYELKMYLYFGEHTRNVHAALLRIESEPGPNAPSLGLLVALQASLRCLLQQVHLVQTADAAKRTRRMQRCGGEQM